MSNFYLLDSCSPYMLYSLGPLVGLLKNTVTQSYCNNEHRQGTAANHCTVTPTVSLRCCHDHRNAWRFLPLTVEPS